MTDGFIKVAAATPEIKVADTVFNANSVIAVIKKAVKEDVKLLVFPELCLTGYTSGDLFYFDTLLKGAEQALRKVIAATEGAKTLVFVGLPVKKEGRIYNCAAAVSDGKLLAVIPKTNLPNYNEFYEKRQFTPAPEKNETFDLCGFTVPFGTRIVLTAENMPSFSVAAEICEDLWVPAPPSLGHAAAGANIVVNLSASDETVGKAEYRRSLVAMQSAKLVSGYVYADAGEGESTTDMVFSGHNIVAENGKILKESKLFENGMTVSEIDVEFISFERSKILSTFKPDKEYETVLFSADITETKLSRIYPKRPFVPEDKSELLSRAELILNIQANALVKRVKHTSTGALVIGVSGGLDSCLALLVCVRAFKKMNRPLGDIIAVSMPCFGTTKRTKTNAQKLAELLGVTFKTVDITGSVEKHLGDIGHDGVTADVTYENAQARERTQVIMDIANSVNGMVVGTGDLSELALGWATYNGDHMSMYGVNASVPKTLVRYLVSFEAERADEKLKAVLNDILATPVSPELLPAKEGEISQKTEDLVGPYDLHDFFLYHFVRCGFGAGKVFRLAVRAFDGEYDLKTVEKWLRTFIRRFFNQQFKRSCLPDGVKVGSVSLSPRGDWRMPSDACSALWLSELDERIKKGK